MTKQEKLMYANSSKAVRKFLVDPKSPRNKQFFAVMDYLVPKPRNYVGI